MSPNTNGQFRPYIGIYAQDLRERRENIVPLNTQVSKYRIENSISDKPPLYWIYIRKGTVSQYIQVTRCISKPLRTYAYTQPSLILMFLSFYIVTLRIRLDKIKITTDTWTFFTYKDILHFLYFAYSFN